MKFKKFFAVLSAVSMLATAAAVNVSAADDTTAPAVGGEDSAKPYSFEYKETAEGAIISNVKAAAGITEIEIPEEDNDGHAVIGVDDFAFYGCTDLATVVVPDSLKLDNIGDLAFLTSKDVLTFLAANGINDAVLSSKTEEEVEANLTKAAEAYIVNTVKFMGKNDWKGDEPELADADDVLENVAKTLNANDPAAFVKDLYTIEDTTKVVRAEDVDTLEKMSAKSYELFKAWVKTIPYVDLTVKASSEDTDAAKYAKGKALLGMKFEVSATHLIGDANQDGVVNVRDCAKIANAVAFKTVDQLPCFKCADYNEDGTVNVRDAAQLANAIATGKIAK